MSKGFVRLPVVLGYSAALAPCLLARLVILVALGAVLPRASLAVQDGETLEQPEALAAASPTSAAPGGLQEVAAKDGERLFLVMVDWKGGHLLRLLPVVVVEVVSLVVELEDEHLDKDDEADEGEGAARLGQDALVAARGVRRHGAQQVLPPGYVARQRELCSNAAVLFETAADAVQFCSALPSLCSCSTKLPSADRRESPASLGHLCRVVGAQIALKPYFDVL